jgi:hypothetical protein
MLVLLAIALGWFYDVVTAQAASRANPDRSTAGNMLQFQSGRYGPYATIRRANEVANYFRSFGLRAEVINGGNWEYYVDVW